MFSRDFLAALLPIVGEENHTKKLNDITKDKLYYNGVPRNSYTMVKLNKVNKETLVVDDIVSLLLPIHKVVIYEIFKDMMQDEETVEVNEFTKWNKDYLVQLLFYASSRLSDLIEDKNSFIEKQAKYRNLVNQGYSLITSINYYKDTELFRLNNSEDSTTPYPINKEGSSAISSFNELKIRADKYFNKYKQLTVK
jgi:hypothetical protein